MTDTKRACDLLITGGQVVDPNAPDGTSATIAVAGTEIVDVGDNQQLRERWAAARVIDASGCLVVPGFVDAHVHLGAFLARSRPYVEATGPGLFAGASRTAEIVPLIVQLTTAPVPADLAQTIVTPVLLSMLRAGFTGVVDAGSSGLPGIAAAIADTGIRAVLGPSVADRWHEDGQLAQRAEPSAQLEIAHQWAREYDGYADGRIRAVASAIEPIAASDELLRGLGERAERLEIPVHLHSYISEAGARDHDAAYGRSTTDRLADAGMLGSRTTLMHVGSVTDEEIARFASAGVTVNQNPIGNALLGFGTAGGAALPRLLRAGVPLVLGSDAAPSMIPTPFELMRAALMIHREIAADDSVLSPSAALTMATNTAAVMGRPGRLGRIAAGQLADLVLVDITGPHHIGDRHPAPALALHANARDIRTVIVNGQVVIDEGRHTTIDEITATQNAEAALSHSQ